MKQVTIEDSRDALRSMVAGLEAKLAQQERQPGECTIAEYAALRGVHWNIAYRELQRLERMGAIEFVPALRLVGNHMVKVFREAEIKMGQDRSR